MALNFWGFPSLKAQTAHKKTYKGQRKGQLETLNIWVEGSEEGLGGFMEEGCDRFGKVKQNWVGEKGDDNDHTEFGGGQEHKLCCSPQMNLSSGRLCVSGLVQLHI